MAMTLALVIGAVLPGIAMLCAAMDAARPGLHEQSDK